MLPHGVSAIKEGGAGRQTWPRQRAKTTKAAEFSLASQRGPSVEEINDRAAEGIMASPRISNCALHIVHI